MKRNVMPAIFITYSLVFLKGNHPFLIFIRSCLRKGVVKTTLTGKGSGHIQRVSWFIHTNDFPLIPYGFNV